MNKLLIALGILFLLVISGCSNKMDEDAEKLIGNFYLNVKSNDYDSNFQYFSVGFLEATTRGKVFSIFKSVRSNVGVLQKYELENYEVDSSFFGEKKGKTITLTYFVTYSGGSTKDSFILFKESGSNDYKIDRFNVNINKVV